jgi:hypothetical protein
MVRNIHLRVRYRSLSLIALGGLAFLLGLAAPSDLSAADPVQPAVEMPGVREIVALRDAFPHRVEDIGFRYGQWAVRIDGEWFFWAEGRFLPLELRDQWAEFVSIRFYNYELGPWTERDITPEQEARLRQRTANRNNDDSVRFNSFLDRLYGVSSRAEAETIMERVTFLGMGTRVHPDVVAPLSRVERRIQNAMMDNQEVRAFVRDLAQIHGYNWRNIAGTVRRSYHAYGMAVDLVPRRWGGGWGYWRWAADGGVPEWWDLPGSQRWQIPQPVIDAFEAEGFVWGGKWLFFDNVHFEYRPEVILLARR